MNREGRTFLQGACPDGMAWALGFDTLHEAWNECRDVLWMRWALSKLGRYYKATDGMGPQEIRHVIGNPFKKQLYCFFCGESDVLLTADEVRDSEIVGTIPRCREHLRDVGLEAA